MAPGPEREKLVSAFNVDICKHDIWTLKPGCWLNDEIINFYGELIRKRYLDQPDKYPKVWVFNTFFYGRLQQGYSNVRRWTKKANDIFTYDYVIVPVHLGNHWVCAVMNIKDKRIEYMDSLLGRNPQCQKLLLDYLKQECLDKRKQELDTSDWTMYTPKPTPNQENSFDCGVFTCMFMEFRSRGQDLTFSQSDMPYLRQRICLEILETKLL
ncbi:hypothetical protein EDD86DRAFT_264628 [Gorgonomyces haynaldii]|nr:hypothetical protein EDD86DRAFT_264628 [Gorgonomyces haynaldii]